jgi:LuxR family quorum-sensing system transcriptional regulator CciR
MESGDMSVDEHRIQGAACLNDISLTTREIECLEWIANGKSSWDIGQILGISPDTVNYHVKKALRKLDVSSRTTAVVRAINLGLIG